MQDILSQVHISDLAEQTTVQDNDVFPIDSTTDTLKVKASVLKQYIGGELASGKIDKTEKGAANGVATLDGSGLVPSSQLPSFVDDVLEGTAQNPTQTAAGTYSATGFILTGQSTPCTLEEGKTYVDTSSNIQYRWTGTGSNLVSMGSGLVLGETQYSAYAGNKGKANADAISALQSGKVDKVNGKGLSTEDFTTEEKQKLATLVVGENYAELSEAYAIGTRNGQPVTSGDVAYHNNSKYHADQAHESEIRSGSFANIAGLSAENAEQSEIRSGSFANVAGLSAENAVDNALKSEGFATGKQNGTDVGSTSPYYHNNAEYFKDLAEEAARQAGGVDMTGATATTDGTHGLIKQPHAGDQNKVFYGDGTWKYAGDVRRSELVDTVGWTGKNLIGCKYYDGTTKTHRGVVWTVNQDKSVTANRTATGNDNSNYYIIYNKDNDALRLKNGKYILSGCPVGGGTNKYWITMRYEKADGTSSDAIYEIGEGVEFTINEDQEYTNVVRLALVVSQNDSPENLVFKPMIRYADIIDDTYEPYHVSVEAELQEVHDEQRILGAKNIFDLTKQEIVPQVATGATLESWSYADGEYTITTSGTSFAGIYLKDTVLKSTLSDYAGIPVILTLEYKKDGEGSAEGVIGINQSGYSRNVTMTSEWKSISEYIADISTVGSLTMYGNNCTFYVHNIMIRLASDTDATFTPYAKTNRQLTLDKAETTEIAKCIDYEMTTPSLSAGSVNITLYNPAITAEMKARPYADYSTSGAYADLTVNTYDGSVNLTGTVSAATTITFRLYTPTVISNIPQ